MPSQLKIVLSRIRFWETLIFQTPTLLGLAMFLPGISLNQVFNVVFVWLGGFLVAAGILAINDWADISLDIQNTLKRDGTFLNKGIEPQHMLYLASSLAICGIGVFASLSTVHMVAAFLAVIFGIGYSVPILGMRGKSIPVVSSFLHFGGTMLSFLLGAMTFSAIDQQSLLIACYPSILITAGHLVHEVEDYEEDRLSYCQTNAVRFGQKPVFFLASLVFAFSFLWLYWLSYVGFFPVFVKYSLSLYLVYLVIAIPAYRAGLTRDSVRRLRDQYRFLFGIIVFALVVMSLLGKWPL